MDPKVQEILSELRNGLEALYGERLRHLVLFGSQARGDAEPGWGSDIDVLAVLAEPVDLDAEDKRTGDLVARLCLQHDMLVSLILMEESRFTHRNGPLLRNIRREGVAGVTADERDLIAEARSSIDAARLLLTGGHAAYAASRAYYAMFYVAEAFLEREGMAFSKHSEVIGAFGRYFTRPGVLPVELHRFLIDACKMRLKADYGPSRAVTAETAAELIRQAQRFVEVAEEHFGPLPPAEAGEGECS